ESVLEPDALTTASSAFSRADIGQENTSTLMKNKSKKKRNSAPMQLHSTNIKVNNYQSDLPLISQKKIRSLSNTVISEDDQDNTDESVLGPDALTTASSALHADIGQKNTSTLVKNKSKKEIRPPCDRKKFDLLSNIEQVTVISEDDQDNINESVLEPDALTTASSAFSHADIGQENTSTL
ncbi:15730_t:CDS:2, partial [Racocetra fulgida]